MNNERNALKHGFIVSVGNRNSSTLVADIFGATQISHAQKISVLKMHKYINIQPK